MVVVQKYTVLGVDAAERRSTNLLRHTQGYARWSARSLAVRHRRIRDALRHGERRETPSILCTRADGVRQHTMDGQGGMVAASGREHALGCACAVHTYTAHAR